MKKITALLRAFVTGSFTLLIAACYGAPIDYNVDNPENIHLNIKDQNGLPIPDIEVSDFTNNKFIQNRYSDKSGAVLIETKDSFLHTLVISDIDGTNNGGPYGTVTNTAYPGESNDIILK